MGNAKCPYRLDYIFHFLWPQIVETEIKLGADVFMHGARHNHAPRLCQPLQTRRDIDTVTMKGECRFGERTLRAGDMVYMEDPHFEHEMRTDV